MHSFTLQVDLDYRVHAFVPKADSRYASFRRCGIGVRMRTIVEVRDSLLAFPHGEHK